MKPFVSRNDASYWGRGVIIPAQDGGWWSLGVYDTPVGSETYHVGINEEGEPKSRLGWPREARGVYFYGLVFGEMYKTIYRLDGERITILSPG